MLSSQPDQACIDAGIRNISVYALEQYEEKWIKHLIMWHLEEQNTQNILLAEDSSKFTPLLFSTYPWISPCCQPFFACCVPELDLPNLSKSSLYWGSQNCTECSGWSLRCCVEESLPLFCWPRFLMKPSNALDLHCSLFWTFPQPVLLPDDIPSQTQDLHLHLLNFLSFPENCSKDRVNDIQFFPISCIANHLIIESY